MASYTATLSVSADDGYTTGPPSSSYTNNIVVAYIGNAAGGAYSLYQRWPNVTIPRGSTISAAAVTMRSESLASSTPHLVNISASAEDNAAAPTTYAGAIAKTPTTAVVAWNNLSTASSQYYATPDLATVIQEIVNRSGWSSGNAILLMYRDNGSTSGNTRQWSTADAVLALRPTISITYTEPPPGGNPYKNLRARSGHHTCMRGLRDFSPTLRSARNVIHSRLFGQLCAR